MNTVDQIIEKDREMEARLHEMPEEETPSPTPGIVITHQQIFYFSLTLAIILFLLASIFYRVGGTPNKYLAWADSVGVETSDPELARTLNQFEKYIEKTYQRR